MTARLPAPVRPGEAPRVAPSEVHPAGLGAVFTRRWVVDMILDLVGYTADEDLANKIAIEPACGLGAFVEPMIHRLIESCRRRRTDVASASGSIRAFDIDPAAVRHTRRLVREILDEAGVDPKVGRRLARSWVTCGDFLLSVPKKPADYVVGNPPYVRIEDVPLERMRQYRSQWKTMAGRADVYVGFLEASLSSLAAGGRLAFICADRWMRNQYGARIRQFVEHGFSVDVSLILHAVDAFEEQVAAYPAVTVIRKGVQAQALVGEATAAFCEADASTIVQLARRGVAPVPVGTNFRATWMDGWFNGARSWPMGTPEILAQVDKLERALPTIEATGITIGIGVATGADAVLVVRADETDIEPDRLVPLVIARDVTSGRIRWSGHYVVNPWEPNGNLADLDRYPNLQNYLTLHSDALRRRHVAMRRPASWWRTIDKIDPQLSKTPKLLLPDLKDRVHPVLEEEGLYPHHNLYYIVSEVWDLRVLGGLLLSDIATSFIEAYSVRMANGYLRVSAQYLRRICLPAAESLTAEQSEGLAAAFESRDRSHASALTRDVLKGIGITI